MLIRFNEISPYGSQYELHEIEGLATLDEFRLNGPLVARCLLKRKEESKIELQGHLGAVLALSCDRCLERFDINVDLDLQIFFEVPSSNAWQLKELQCVASDLDTVLLDEPVIDLDDVFRQQLYLSLPMKNLCTETCRGICTRCGMNLNIAQCGCPDEVQGSPFAILSQKRT